jgi:PKD repeat protein
VDILAPTILPTTDIAGSGGYDPSDYSMFNGTSCSTPFAAGVAALIKSQNPGWTPIQIRQQIVDTAFDVQNVESGVGWDRYSGYGMINAGAALGGSTGNVGPVANANGPYIGDAGVAITLSSSGSFDNVGFIVSYEWDFGDGNTSTQTNPTHTYTSAGNYIVSLTVTDDDGATGTDSTSATIVEPCSNHELVLTLVLDNYPGETTWELKDVGNNILASGGPYSAVGATVTETFCLTGGNYTFAIYDSFGDGLCCTYGSGSYELSAGTTIYASGESFENLESTSFTLSTQGNTPPVADAGGPYSGTVDQVVSFNGSSSSDPDSDPLTYSWDFGDVNTGTGASPSHTYAASSTYAVTLTVDDGNGDTDSDMTTAVIAAGGGYTVLTYDDFENGWGNYSDGGSDCSLYTGGTYAHQGSAAANIQDNSGTASSFYHTNSIDVETPGYTEIKVEFYFHAISMDNSNEDFQVQYYDGSNWNTVANYAQGIDFNNNQFYFETVLISESQYTFSTNMKIRFQCDASANGDDVYIDEIKVSALAGGPTDTTPPTVTITSPTALATYTASSSNVDIGGTAADDTGVTQVTWSNDRGGSGTAVGITSWSVSGIPLQSGDNVLTVTAMDAANNSSTDVLTVTYNPPGSTPVVVWTAANQNSGGSWSNSGWDNRSFRILLDGTFITTSGSTVQLTLRGRSSGSYTVQRMSLVQRDGGTLNGVDSTNQPVTFGGTWDSGVTVPAGGTVTSDPIPFNLVAGQDVFLTYWVPAGNDTVYRNGGGSTSTWSITGSDQSATIDWGSLGITDTRSHIYVVELMEVVN